MPSGALTRAARAESPKLRRSAAATRGADAGRARWLGWEGRPRRSRGPVDLVEQGAVGEMRGLRLAPAAERLVDGDHGDRLEGLGVLRLGGGFARPEVAPADDVLRQRAIEEVQVAGGDQPGP